MSDSACVFLIIGLVMATALLAGVVQVLWHRRLADKARQAEIEATAEAVRLCRERLRKRAEYTFAKLTEGDHE
jgi:hypothetical protein